VNFDWARQDSKPGLLNLNLIVDEEVFFSVAGQQHVSQQNGQYVDATGATATTPPSDQFTQQLLNFDQVTMPLNGLTGVFTHALAPGNYTATGLTLPLAAGVPPIPMVVTSTQFHGGPASAYPLFNTTSSFSAANLDNDPINNFFVNTTTTPPQYTANLKAAWVQFLTARHGGSGYVFGFGHGAVGQNVAIASATGLPGYNGIAGAATAGAVPGPLPMERPFHSLSYPDIDFTIMRPAALPPGVTVPATGPAVFYTVPNAHPLPGEPAATLYGNANPTTFGAGQNPWQNPASYAAVNHVTGLPLWNTFVGDPGVRNFFLYSGHPTATYPGTPLPAPAGATTPTAAPYNVWPVYPPPIPLRRLFQVPDAYSNAANLVVPNPGTTMTLPTIEVAPAAPVAASISPSNASETGDPTINVVSVFSPTAPAAITVPIPAPGALPPITYSTTGTPPTTHAGVLTNSVLNLYWPTSYATTTTPGTAAAATMITTSGTLTAAAVNVPPAVGNNVYYGFGASGTLPDNRQHPLWRIEQLQHLMNLTTTRTHQYAVWITVGFFQVKRQGDLAMFAIDPQLAFDIMGPEIGAANGKATRYRGFYLVDRLQLTGFNPASSTNFRAAVVYRNRIQ
jgi:large repetitive protein